MKPNFTSILVALLCCMQVSAQFSGTYAPANWTTSRSANSNGTMNVTGAPASIVVTGSDDPTGVITSPETIDFTIAVPVGGTLSFNWAYHTNDSYLDASYDHGGVLINGVFTKLSDDGGGVDQSGNYTSGPLIAGTVIGFRILATDNTFGDATFTISSFQISSSTLPVTGLQFRALKTGDDIKLDWSTLTESNSDYFNILHSTDGINFAPVGRKAAAGNSTAARSYTWQHTNPAAGKNFYQLQQVDIDGRMMLSEIVQVYLGNVKIRISPNPFSSAIVINYPYTGKTASIAIINTSGAVVLRKAILGYQTSINVNSLPAGLYLAEITDDKKNVETIRIIKY